MTVHTFAADANRGWSLHLAIARVGAMLHDLSEQYRRRRRYREIEAELLDYSPEQLAELEISEADIDRVARYGSQD